MLGPDHLTPYMYLYVTVQTFCLYCHWTPHNTTDLHFALHWNNTTPDTVLLSYCHAHRQVVKSSYDKTYVGRSIELECIVDY